MSQGKNWRFAAIEPWRAPLYSLGTRVFGKREANVFCRPLDCERLAPLKTADDDSLANLVPGLRRLGSSIALLGTKSSAVSQASRQ